MVKTQLADEFSAIAPYPDCEIKHRLRALSKEPKLLEAASALRFKNRSKLIQQLIRPLISYRIQNEVRKIHDRASWHKLLVHYIRAILDQTSDGFTHSGSELIPRDKPSVFISNHRDITLDPVLVNYALWLNEFPTCQIAIGDNLLAMEFAAEFMRINDSFIVVRNVQGLKSQFAALNRTSRYIRHVLAQGQGIWIAQREGRSKDGSDRTDPAVLKMLALADREQSRDINVMLENINLVPITFTYELDPCATRKAMELAQLEKTGHYIKAKHEDRDSLIVGITGFKGRIHLAFDRPLHPRYADADALAAEIDRVMRYNRKPFPFFKVAAALLNGNAVDLPEGRAGSEFKLQWQSLHGRERELFLQQYANQASSASG